MLSNDTLKSYIIQTDQSVDAMWIVITTFIIFTMQSGFGLLESGMVSRKNEANVMVKNMIDVILGGFSFWLVGFGLAFGSDGNEFSGKTDFFTSVDLEKYSRKYSMYFQQLALATTATTIVSGAIAERVSLLSYMVYATIHTGLIYPFPAHWLWNREGWLRSLGARDFAGCCVVHVSGGAAALVACIIIGPRRNRFGSEKSKYTMASPTNVILGTFFLWFGWIGFNCGSTRHLSEGGWKIATRTAVITMQGAIGGGISAIFLSICFKLLRRGYLLDIGQLSLGLLGGLVGITGLASSCEPWEGLIIGFIGGMVANGGVLAANKMRIDDPVGAISVHWGAGCWGMIATGLFGQNDVIVHYLETDGIFHGGNGRMLGANILAIVVTSFWAGILTAILVIIMKHTIQFRMSETNEIRGSDDVEHDIKDPLVIFEATHTFGKRLNIPQPKPLNEVVKPIEDNVINLSLTNNFKHPSNDTVYSGNHQNNNIDIYSSNVF